MSSSVAVCRSPPTPPLFSSLKNGMQQLVDALLAQLRPASLRTGTAVEEVSYSSEKWRVQANGRAENFDGVIFAAPAHVVAALLSTAAPELARELGGISYSSSITTTLIYDRATLDGTEYLSCNPLLGPGTGERDAPRSTMDDVHSPAGVTDQIAATGIVGVEHPAAPPASQEAGEQSVAPAARLARTPGEHEIIFAEHAFGAGR